ncbi:MAG TPA: hypothetical protein DDY78_10885 [Planctomycetales bacterium]|nr:hypothetical protein [Planctomycetales bacterium]
MNSRLGWYFRAKRLAQGVAVEDLAVRMGYRRVRKAVRRILRLELYGRCSDAMFINLADALGIRYDTILDLMEKDVTFPMHRIVANRAEERPSRLA